MFNLIYYLMYFFFKGVSIFVDENIFRNFRLSKSMVFVKQDFFSLSTFTQLYLFLFYTIENEHVFFKKILSNYEVIYKLRHKYLKELNFFFLKKNSSNFSPLTYNQQRSCWKKIKIYGLTRYVVFCVDNFFLPTANFFYNFACLNFIAYLSQNLWLGKINMLFNENNDAYFSQVVSYKILFYNLYNKKLFRSTPLNNKKISKSRKISCFSIYRSRNEFLNIFYFSKKLASKLIKFSRIQVWFTRVNKDEKLDVSFWKFLRLSSFTTASHLINITFREFLVEKLPIVYLPQILNKWISDKSARKIKILFLRKNKIFNKSRYSRNRQLYRTGFFWCLWFSILLGWGLYFIFYRFTFTFSYFWWVVYIGLSLFIFVKAGKFRLYNPSNIFKEIFFFSIWLYNLNTNAYIFLQLVSKKIILIFLLIKEFIVGMTLSLISGFFPSSGVRNFLIKKRSAKDFFFNEVYPFI